MTTKNKISILIDYRRFINNIIIPYFSSLNDYHLTENTNLEDLFSLHDKFKNEMRVFYDDFEMKVDDELFTELTKAFHISFGLDDDTFFSTTTYIRFKEPDAYVSPNIPNLIKNFSLIAEVNIFQSIISLIQCDNVYFSTNQKTNYYSLFYIIPDSYFTYSEIKRKLFEYLSENDLTFNKLYENVLINPYPIGEFKISTNNKIFFNIEKSTHNIVFNMNVDKIKDEDKYDRFKILFEFTKLLQRILDYRDSKIYGAFSVILQERYGIDTIQ